MLENNLECPYCHEEIKPNLKFCTHCGRSLVTEDSNSEVENSINSSSSEARETRSLEKPELKSSSNKKKKILWSMGAIACTILLIAGITFSFSIKPNGDTEALKLIQNQVISLDLVYGDSSYQENKQNNDDFINFYSSHSFSENIKEYIDMYEKGCEKQNHSSATSDYVTKPSWIKGEQIKLEATLNLSSIEENLLSAEEIENAMRSYFYCQYLYDVKSNRMTKIEEDDEGEFKRVFNFFNQTGYDIKKIAFSYRVKNERTTGRYPRVIYISDFENNTTKKIEFYILAESLDDINDKENYFSASGIEIEQK